MRISISVKLCHAWHLFVRDVSQCDDVRVIRAYSQETRKERSDRSEVKGESVVSE